MIINDNIFKAQNTFQSPHYVLQEITYMTRQVAVAWSNNIIR